MPGGDDYYDEIDEGILDTLIIFGLAAALVFLIYYRQQRQVNHRREVVVQQQVVPGVAAGAPGAPAPGGEPHVPGQQVDGGFFPPPGDPNFNQWVAGGVGH